MSRQHRIPGTPRSTPRRALFVLPSIPDDAPAALKDALAIRNACATEGRCPACGTLPTLERDDHGIHHLTFEHEDDCPCLLDGEASA